ncbi:MAG: tripartite tricarboxylate transporter substrate binding protein [Betaproteobacteria bacterium]|jgi:tripartite-type tricarboxylate transporter receptor subunit TctC|nr:tripartite tricarboxylate transporter substrate binding protein [Betaproteobacteria bacterium]MDH5342316.1 tripartite tricarboxylate transporter substrate binding protein [Betaproteobacteria bacterium]
MNSVLRFLPVVLAGLLVLPLSVAAQKYPDKPVRVVIVFPPGGSNDVVGRIVYQKVGEIMGQQFIIDNRGGAAGQIGSEIVAQSPPDGYTVMVQSTTHVANAHLYKKLNYDVLKDFIGVTTLARQVGMLVVHPSLPVKTGKEFIALAKKRPGEIVYGSAGNGSYVHLSMALMASMANIKMIHVPYKGGGPSGTALVGGETQAMLATIGSLFTHIKSGRVRPLGVSADQRVSQFPNVPAIAEFVPGYEFTAWVGTFVPAGTPKAVVDTLNAALAKALADKTVAEKLTAQTLDPMHMTPEAFAARIRSDYDKYAKVVKISGARVD